MRESTRIKVKEEIELGFSDELEDDDGEGSEDEKAKLTSSLFFFELNITVLCCLT